MWLSQLTAVTGANTIFFLLVLIEYDQCRTIYFYNKESDLDSHYKKYILNF